MKKSVLFLLSIVASNILLRAQKIIDEKNTPGAFALVQGNNTASIYVDDNDFETVKKAVALFQQDIEMVTGKTPAIINKLTGSEKNLIIIGSINKSALISQLIKQKKINTSSIAGKWEAYQLQT